jgi:uridine kinase
MEDGTVAIGALLRAAPPRAGNTRIVAIDGRSGSGKTTLAVALRAKLDAPVISLDYLYGGWDGLERGIDLLAAEVLEPLAKGQTALIPHYNWSRESWDEPTPLDPPELLIVEGVGAGARRAAGYESALVWLESPLLVRKRRALERDGETFTPFWDQWAAQEDAMLGRERTPERADLILET